MIDKLSRLYLYVLAGMMLILLIGLVILHGAYLRGTHFEPNGRVFASFFGVNMPILGLAENRNIWKHELRECPQWLRLTFKSLFAYAMIVMILCVLGNMHIPGNFFLAASAFMLMFSCATSCVLYAAIKSSRVDHDDLRQRTKRSLLAVASFSAFYLVYGLFPNPAHIR